MIRIAPFKGKYLQIFKGDHYYLLDRNKYDINKIMMLLDLKKLNTLGEKFRKYEEGVEKTEFIRLIKDELGTNPADLMDETNLVYGLHKFFCEIDFNGDGHMQWEEFTQFIIDTVEGETQAAPGLNDEDNNTGKILNEKKMQKYKRYEISEKIKDNQLHKTEIIGGIFLPKSDSFIIFEYGTKVLKIYNPLNGRIKKTIEIDKYINSYHPQEKTEKKKKNFKKNSIGALLEKNKDKTKKIEEADLRYTVLSIFASTWIIGICLTNSVILFFSFNSEGKCELLYKIKTPSLQKRLWYLPEHNIWFSSGAREEGEPFYYINELDVEFEIKNQRILSFVNEGHAYRARYCRICEHSDEIYDVIEINRPFLILTACLDGVIRLINISDNDYLKTWRNHSLGVTHLDYNPSIESTGYIISCGFEYFINIYSTDLSIEEAFKGRLEGHIAPVVNCRFLADSYMIVSVDTDGFVRIWDSKQRICLQVIQQEMKRFKINDLIFMEKYNTFAVYGNKLVFYDPKYNEDEKIFNNAKMDDNYPLFIDYNKYYQQFYVTTMRDVRIFSSKGELVKIFKKCRENEHFEPGTKIKYFIFENNYRKFYLGFSNGAVMQYNAGNGSLIKPINEAEVEKDGILTFKYDHAKEVSSLYYFYQYGEDADNFLLVTTGLDSIINIYNEANPEETEKLRVLKGGHTINDKKCEILCMDFSPTLCLLATGSVNGLIVIWDFEMSKIDDVCYINPFKTRTKIDVMSLKFLDPYPLLAGYYSNGVCCIWGVKPLLKNKGFNFLRFENFFTTLYRVEVCSITCSLFLCEDMEKEPPREFLLKNYFFGDKKPPKERKRKEDEKEEENEEEEPPELEISEQHRYDTIDQALNPDQYTNEGNERNYLYLADNKGYVKIVDLKGLINKYEIEKCSQTIIRSNFNILKKEVINVDTILAHNIQKEKKLSNFINLYLNGMVIREWKAHDDMISSICKVENPFCIITLSKDKYMKLWNEQCEAIGEINILPKLTRFLREPIEWKFETDEKKILENEIKEVVRIFEEVGVEKIEIGSKEDKESEKIQIEEKVEKEPVVLMKPTEYHKRRYRPIDRKRKPKTIIEEDKLNTSYEGLYLIEMTRKIDAMLSQEGSSQGIGCITSKVYDVLSKEEEKPKEKEPTENSKQTSKNISKRNSSKRTTFRNSSRKFSKQHSFSMNPSPSKFFSSKTKTSFFSNGRNLEKNQNNSNGFSLSSVQNNSKSTKNVVSRIPGKKIFSGKPSTNGCVLSNLSTKTWKPKTPSVKEVRFYATNTSFKTSLYSEKFLKHDEKVKSKLKITDLKTQLLLPVLRYENKPKEKMQFSKGETEKLLQYEFYQNSYKNSCEIHRSQDISNASLMIHHKDLWANVTKYTNGKRRERGSHSKIFLKKGEMKRSYSNKSVMNPKEKRIKNRSQELVY